METKCIARKIPINTTIKTLKCLLIGEGDQINEA